MGPIAPTDTELAVLRVLWARGPSTVRDVHEALYGESGVGYTTSLKLLQNMLGKRLVLRDDASRQHVYRAAVSERPTIAQHVRRMVDRTFNGSGAELAMRALESRPVTSEELAELKKLIRQLERDGA